MQICLCEWGSQIERLGRANEEQETAKMGGKKKKKEDAVQETTSIQDTAAVQNIYPSTSLPMNEMPEPYMTINTFSQILKVIFQSNTPFF